MTLTVAKGRLLRRLMLDLAPLAVAAAIVATVILPAQAVGVRPLVIDLPLDPGSSGRFELTFVPSGAPERVQVRLYQPVQLPTGDLTYQLADPARFPAAGWVRLERTSIEVPAQQEIVVGGQVNVPFGAQGSHTVVLMVEPESRGGGTVGVQIRYAVRLHIRVSGVTQPPRLDIRDLRLDTGSGKAYVRVNAINPSPSDYLVEGEVTIRDANRRLVERIPLLTEQARRAGQTQTRLYPGSTVELSGPVGVPLAAGTYELRVFIRYADRLQASTSQQVTLEQAVAESGSAAASRVIALDAGEVLFTTAPGGLTSRTVTVTNLYGQPILVQGYAREVAAGYAFSIWKYIRLRTQLPLTLRPGEQGRIVLSAQSDRGQEPGGYYGTLVLRAWPAEADPASAKPIDEVEATLGLVVGQGGDPAVTLGSVEYRPAPGAEGDVSRVEGLLAVSVANGGPVHATLNGRVRLETEDGTLVGQWSLAPEGDRQWLVRGSQGMLVARVPALSPGKYRAAVRVESGGRVLADDVRDLTVR